MKHAFISYVRENNVQVSRLTNDLQKAKIRVWVDRNELLPGDHWKEVIRDAIKNGACFIACFSKEYLEKDRSYMNEELTLAIEEMRMRPVDKTWFIPVAFARNTIPDRAIGAGQTLRDIQWLDLSKGPDTQEWDDAIRNLIQVVEARAQDHKSKQNSAFVKSINEAVSMRAEASLLKVLKANARETINAALNEWIAGGDTLQYDYILRPLCEVYGRQFDRTQVVRLATRGEKGIRGQDFTDYVASTTIISNTCGVLNYWMLSQIIFSFRISYNCVNDTLVKNCWRSS